MKKNQNIKYCYTDVSKKCWTFMNLRLKWNNHNCDQNDIINKNGVWMCGWIACVSW